MTERRFRRFPSDLDAKPAPVRRLRKTAMFARHFAIFGVAIALAGAPQSLAAQDSITVFAAASLRNALDDTDAAFSKTTGVKVVASYAASSALMKQIEQGAPADVFVSADLHWMDYAVEHKLIKPDTRVNLLGNRLVLIAATDSKLDKVDIRKGLEGLGFDIAKLAGDDRIAVADVKAVPAGRYAKAALESLGAWPAAERKLAMAENVRAALAFVARGETPIGIVYETDAKVEPTVKIIGVFPEGSHPPVIYPVAATAATANPAVARYINFLRAGAAKAIFERYGFSFLISPTS
jgi:molybdate transport system substrate-binding protein